MVPLEELIPSRYRSDEHYMTRIPMWYPRYWIGDVSRMTFPRFDIEKQAAHPLPNSPRFRPVQRLKQLECAMTAIWILSSTTDGATRSLFHPRDESCPHLFPVRNYYHFTPHLATVLCTLCAIDSCQAFLANFDTSEWMRHQHLFASPAR
jgi:hypothetical protein